MGRKQSLPDEIQSHKTLIENTIGTPSIQDEVALCSYTPEKMGEGKALLDQTKESGEAQAATDARDKKLVELERWCADYKAVARVVFEDRPQMLEILGIIVKS